MALKECSSSRVVLSGCEVMSVDFILLEQIAEHALDGWTERQMDGQGQQRRREITITLLVLGDST